MQLGVGMSTEAVGGAGFVGSHPQEHRSSAEMVVEGL